MLLCVIGSKNVSEDQIQEFVKILEEELFISFQYYDTFHDSGRMVEEADAVLVFHRHHDQDEDHAEKTRAAIKEAMRLKKPVFAVILRGGESQENYESEEQTVSYSSKRTSKDGKSIRKNTKTVGSLFSKIKGRKKSGG